MKNRYLDDETITSRNTETEHVQIFITKGSSEGELLLQWDALENAQNYIIEISKTGTDKWAQVDIIKEPHYAVCGLKTGREYSFRIIVQYTTGRRSYSRISTKKIN